MLCEPARVRSAEHRRWREGSRDLALGLASDSGKTHPCISATPAHEAKRKVVVSESFRLPPVREDTPASSFLPRYH